MNSSVVPRHEGFDGQVVAVFGGATGIGRAVAEQVGVLGASVAVLDINLAGARDVAEELSRAGIHAFADAVDVLDEEGVAASVGRVAAWAGGLDRLVYSVGRVIETPLESTTFEQWHAVLDTNVTGAWLVGKAALPYLREARQPAIVNVSSVGGTNAYPGGGAYGASKRALIALSEQMAVEWGRWGVRVNTASPGTTATPKNDVRFDPATRALRESQVPLQRLGTSEDLADAIVFLLSDGASYITGHDLVIDGGLSKTVFSSPDGRFGTRSWGGSNVQPQIGQSSH